MKDDISKYSHYFFVLFCLLLFLFSIQILRIPKGNCNSSDVQLISQLHSKISNCCDAERSVNVIEAIPIPEPDSGGNEAGNTDDERIVIIDQIREESGAEVGDLTISLSWTNKADLDLFVKTPSGELIFHQDKNGQFGGKLDHDANKIHATSTTTPIENMFWAIPPSGDYSIGVSMYRSSEKYPVGFEFDLSYIIYGVPYVETFNTSVLRTDTVPVILKNITL